MRRWSLLGLSVLLVAAPLVLAQRPAQRPAHVVRGVVFDSVARAPLAGAVVQVVWRDSLSRPVSTTTDATGHFRFAGLPSGRFMIGFYHDALRALALDAPVRAFELAAETNVTLDLAIPSGAVVRALRCGGDSAVDRDGLFAGFIRDAGRDGALVGAMLVAEWNVIALDPGDFHVATQHVKAFVGEDGRFAACGVPVDAPLTIRVTAPGRRPITVEIVVPPSGAARQDFRLADSAAVGGAATLTGRVEYDNGGRLRSGRVLIAELARDVPVVNGAFTMTGLPPGTWLAEVRAIGLAPQSALVDVMEGAGPPAKITITDRPPQLEAVTVIGASSRNSKLLDDILRRKRASSGSVFMQGNPWFDGALHPADVLRAARGFRFIDAETAVGRAGCSPVGVFLDGLALPDGLAGLNPLVSMREVLAIETYPDIMFAPVQWQMSAPSLLPGNRPEAGGGACAIVLVWTKR